MGTIGDGSIPIVSIDTFGLIFIDVIDPSVKDFLFLIDSIDNRSLKTYLTDGHRSIGTHWIDSIDRYYRSRFTPEVSIHRLKILEVWPMVSIIGEKNLIFDRLYRSIGFRFFFRMMTIDLIDVFCRYSIIGLDPIDVFFTLGAQLCFRYSSSLYRPTIVQSFKGFWYGHFHFFVSVWLHKEWPSDNVGGVRSWLQEQWWR